MHLNRRGFGKQLVAGVGLAAVPSIGLGAPSSETGSPDVNELLRHVAPELRHEVCKLLKEPQLQFSEVTLPQIQQSARSARSADGHFMPGIPVKAERVMVRSGMDEVLVYVINSRCGMRRPAIVYMHGGGFVAGTAKGQVARFQALAAALDCTIVSVEYQLAPAARFSTAIEENYAALKWLFRHSDALGVDASRIALMGESAGGTHAATLAFTARDRGEVPVLFQLLVYPALDDRTASTRTLPPHLGAFGWTASSHRFAWKSYLGMEPGQSHVPTIAVPARRLDLADLPSTWIGVGGIDLLAPEALDYARRLMEAAVPTELHLVPGAHHGFDKLPDAISLVTKFNEAKLTALRRAFAGEWL